MDEGRTERVAIRMTATEKAEIQGAARKAGLDTAQFTRWAALAKARETQGETK